jgi:hypothetical protein
MAENLVVLEGLPKADPIILLQPGFLELESSTAAVTSAERYFPEPKCFRRTGRSQGMLPPVTGESAASKIQSDLPQT